MARARRASRSRIETHEQAAERASSRRTDRCALSARLRASRARAGAVVSGVPARSPRSPDGRRASGHLSAARVRRRGAVAHRVARLPARGPGRCRVCLDRDCALRGADARARCARVLPTGSRAVRRRCRDGGGVRADVLPVRGGDRPHERRGQQLDDVRLLHQEQRRRRIPVLRERSCRGIGEHLLSRVQRRADRRGRGLSDRTRLGRHVLLVRRDARCVRAHGDRPVRRRGTQARAFVARSGPAHAPPESRPRRARMRRHRLRRDGHADRRGGHRGVLVVGRLDSGNREVRRRGCLLDRRARIPRAPGPSCS